MNPQKIEFFSNEVSKETVPVDVFHGSTIHWNTFNICKVGVLIKP